MEQVAEQQQPLEEPIDLLPPRPLGPGEPLLRLLSLDFCQHEAVSPPRARAATVESHVSVGSHPESGSEDAFEQVVQNVWDNFVRQATQLASNVTGDDKALDVPREVFPADTETETTSVIITEPGTGRRVRVFRGLELFVLAVFLLGMTFHLLRRLGGLEMTFVLERKEL